MYRLLGPWQELLKHTQKCWNYPLQGLVHSEAGGSYCLCFAKAPSAVPCVTSNMGVELTSLSTPFLNPELDRCSCKDKVVCPVFSEYFDVLLIATVSIATVSSLTTNKLILIGLQIWSYPNFLTDNWFRLLSKLRDLCPEWGSINHDPPNPLPCLISAPLLLKCWRRSFCTSVSLKLC